MACVRRRRGRWVVDYRDTSGQRRWVTCSTKREAEKVLAEKLREAGQPTKAVVEMNITVADYAVRWLSLLENNVKPRTLRSYEENLRIHLLPLFGGAKLRLLARGRIKSFLVDKQKERLSRNTVRLIHATLRAMLNYAIDDGVIVHNPADRLGRQLRLTSSPTERDAEIKAFDRLQLTRLLDEAATSEPEYYPLFLTLARAGLRLGEAFALTWEDVDFESRSIRVEQAVSAGSLSSTKSRRSRDVDMSAQLREVLRSPKSGRLEQVFMADREAMPCWVFVNSAGQRMDQSRVSKVFKRVLKAAELPLHYTPHCLRHTFASLLLQQGESPAYVQRQLGHASIQLTVDTYGRWLPMGNKAAVDRLDDGSGSRTVANTPRPRRVGPVSRIKQWSRRVDLNHRPADYESAALPLSYTGSSRGGQGLDYIRSSRSRNKLDGY